MDNAVKFNRPGGEVKVECKSTAQNMIQISVSDTGMGIPSGDTAKIFERFYRVQKGDRVRAGTGLGLAISRGFIEAMHGKISAANRTDKKGAVLTIMLPARTASGDMDAAA